MKSESLRLNITLAAILLLSSLILYRLFVISYVRHSVYSRTAQAQNENISNVLVRGGIYLDDPSAQGSGSYLAATNKKFPLAYVVPLDVADERNDEIAAKLSEILSLDRGEIQSILNTNQKSSKILARRLSQEQFEKIRVLNTKGVNLKYEADRFYPGNAQAANVLGYFGNSSQGKAGQYGIELFYQDELAGQKTAGSDGISLVSEVKQLFGQEKEEAATITRPADIYLTIDKNVQVMVEQKLDELIKKWSGAGGTIIVQDPTTGKILAMADRPTFDPNIYSQAEPRSFLNRSVQEEFEPGSSFKPIKMAMGLDLGKITPQTTFTDEGSVTIGGYTIKNFSERIFGTITMSQVLEKSVNTGTMHVQKLVGDEQFLNYAVNMGFGQRTGIDLPGEINGDITNLYSGRKINYLTASFGQGIAVTPLQLINAYSAIANGGKLMRPYIVQKIAREGGGETVIQPEVVSIPIAQKTAQKVAGMLVNVVDNGFDKARIEGYDVAGKTGTAQIPDGKGGYLEDEFIHDFVGFAPAYNPKFTILIKLDKPKGITFAADSLSPTFRDISKYLLTYYNIPPTRR